MSTYYGLSKEEQQFLAIKRLKEGKTPEQTVKEVKQTNGAVIRQGFRKAYADKEYVETHKEETFKNAFNELKKRGKR